MIRKTIFVAVVTGLALTFAAPARPLSACVFDLPLPPYQMPTPFPACEAASAVSHARLRNKNVRIGMKMIDLVMEVQQTKAEIRGWQQTIEKGKNIENELKKIQGDLNINPMGSLIAAYERSPMLAWVKTVDGMRQKVMSASIGDLADFVETDLRARADSILGVWNSPDSLRALYWTAGMTAADKKRDEQFMALTGALQDQLAALEKFKKESQAGADSLKAIGNRLASRYGDMTDPGGEAEARITNLSASIAKLRGTAFETRGQAVHDRIQAITLLNHAKEAMDASRRKTLSIHSGF